MSQDEFSVDLILEGIESTMTVTKQPKVLLFDIGGVCRSINKVALIYANTRKVLLHPFKPLSITSSHIKFQLDGSIIASQRQVPMDHGINLNGVRS